MALTVTKVMDANVYVNNTSKHGQASEITCPDVSYKMDDFQALGLVGTPKYFSGLEAMEATIKWTYPDNDAQIALANPFQPVELMIRSNKMVLENDAVVDNQPVTIYLRALPTKHPGGSFKAKEAVEVEHTFAVNRYKLEVNGEEIIEIDVPNNIFRIGGEDILSDYRTNLGI